MLRSHRLGLIATVLSAGALTLATRAPFASAHPPARRYAPYSIEVQDQHGAPLRTFEHGGQLFVLGSRGQRYTLLLQNDSAERVEAVVTVDGRDVVTGQIGDFVRGRGYVLAPYAALRIEGFRTSLDEVATFRFSTPAASYSARLGTPEHVGVIGAAFFPERRRSPRPRPIAPMSGADSDWSAPPERARSSAAEAEAPPSSAGEARAASPSVDNLGTEYGEARRSQVEEVRFVRASPTQPAHLSVLRYDNRDGLIARGIELEPRGVTYHHEPRAFPHNRFAPPPP